MAPNKTVSVIIPSYNNRLYLPEAVGSVLSQTYQPVEVIIVDDGSTDGSRGMAGGFPAPVRCLCLEHRGAGAARNAGVQLAVGEFLAFLDADDLWARNKLERQVGILMSHTRADMVFGRAMEFISPELEETSRNRLRYSPDPLDACLPGTVLIWRASFLRVGFFRTDLRLGEFIDWYARAMESGLVGVKQEDVVLHRRIHADNLGIRERAARSDYLRVIKTALDRRRDSSALGKSRET